METESVTVTVCPTLGATQTMHPLIGSPAIDAGGTTNPGGTDQRGFPRFADGDGSGTAQLDIGAVESWPRARSLFVPDHPVTTDVDEDDGSILPGFGTGTAWTSAWHARRFESECPRAVRGEYVSSMSPSRAADIPRNTTCAHLGTL